MILGFILAVFFAISSGTKLPVRIRNHVRNSSIKDHPYFGSIELYNKTHCGCVIVSENFVLTAAHCVDNWNEEILKVRVGTSVRESGGSLHDVKKIIMHEDFHYKNGVAVNDIAVLKVEKPIDFNNDTIRKATLFGKNEELKASTIAVVGYGIGGNGLSKNLKIYYNHFFQNHQKACKGTFKGRVEFLSSQFCSGFLNARGKGIVSEEDAGGPFISNGRLAGILSYLGSGYAGASQGEIYTKISYFRKWIEAQTSL